MVNGECVARCAGDQDQSWCWLAYGVSHHSLRWDLLGQPVRPSVAGGHMARVHQLVHGLDENGSSLFVAVFVGTGVVAPSFDEPGETGDVVSKLGQFHSVWLVLEHVIEDGETACFPALLQARVPVCVGDHDVHSHRRVVLVFASPGSQV